MTSSFSLRNIASWIDDNILLILSLFLIAFIPLFPKIPVWSPIEQYIVRVRIEDFFLLFASVIWIIQVLRKKVAWRSPFFWAVVIYEVIALLSTLSAIYITQTIPMQMLHIQKSFLHFFRYIEYFSFFFIIFSSIKKRSHVLLLASVFAFTVIAVTLYGYGQKYYSFPVYSTMNREFSKGIRLVLTPHARVQSTFAGHYDMAAFLVISLPILLALAYSVKNKKLSWLFHVSYWFGTWLIIVSASRSSFGAFLGTACLVIGLTAWHRETLVKKIKFATARTVFILFFSLILFAFFGADLTERFYQVLDSHQQFHDAFHTYNKEKKAFLAMIHKDTPKDETTSQSPTPAPLPSGTITTDEAIKMGILTPTDERPIVAKPVPTPSAPLVPKDVYVPNLHNIVPVATVSASGAAQIIMVDKGPRTYSQNAINNGLSLAIRLDTTWPDAIAGWKTNIFLGKGYATLSKGKNLEQFTEAESTDNNFLRTLGETGLLGFLSFYGCMVVVLFYCYKAYRTDDALARALAIGVAAASLGFLINAIYIDVFAASKDAEIYWGVCGLFMGYYFLTQRQRVATHKKKNV